MVKELRTIWKRFEFWLRMGLIELRMAILAKLYLSILGQVKRIRASEDTLKDSFKILGI